MPDADPPRIVGIDDWALRKGRTYATIVVDLERRRPSDLLPDRVRPRHRSGLVESFATGLGQDAPAVRAGLRLPWSRRQVEG